MPLAPPLLRLGFDHGVKASLDPTAVPPNALWRARNVRLYQGGLARVRPGSFALTQSRGPGSPQGLIAAFGGLLMVHDTNLVLYDLATGSGTELGTGITSDPTTPVEMIRWTRGGAEIVYLFTGEGIWETDGTEGGTKLVEPYEPQQGEASNLLLDSDTGDQDVNSDPAKSRIALLRVSDGQRIVAAHGNVVSMCEPLDATYWPADQQFWLPEDGGRIMALEQWYGAVILFRDRDIWAYFKAYEGDEGGKGPTIQIKSIGCAAGRTVVPIPGLGLAFVGGPQGTVDNVYLLTYVQAIEGQVRAEPIGGDIRDILVEAVRRYGLEGACATYYDGEYRLSIPANAEEDRVFVLDIRNQRGWFIDSGPRTVQYAIEGGNLYSAAWGEGRIDRITPEVLRDGDKPIPLNIRWRRESLLGPSRVKRVFVVTKSPATVRPTEVFWWQHAFGGGPFGAGETVTTDARTGTDQTLDLKVYVDGRQFQVERLRVVDRHQEELGRQGYEPVRIYEARFRPSLKGHFIQLEVNATTPDEDIAILGYGIEYGTRSRIRGQREGVAT